MADHPFVALRGHGDSLEPFVLGTGRPVWELVEAVRSASGSVTAAAEALGLSAVVVQTAVDYYDDCGVGAVAVHRPRTAPAPAPDEPKSALERAGQVAALFTAFAAIIYIAGGAVLGTRLYFARVPAEAVIGQLPRELLLTIGVGQILLPVLAFAAVYGGYRLVRGDRARVPSTPPWGDTGPILGGRRLRFVSLVLVVALAIVAPGAVFAIFRRDDLHRPFWWLVAAFAISGIVGFVAVEIRARLAKAAFAAQPDERTSWATTQSIIQMTALWAALLVPAAIIFWPAFIQLQGAKVCTTSGFEEVGELIGQTSDGVFLAEHKERLRRRVATFTTAEVEEAFVGPDAAEARCDPSGLRGAALASRGAATALGAYRGVSQSWEQAQDNAPALVRAKNLQTLADRAVEVAADARDVATAADRTTPGVARPIFDAADRADRAARRLKDSAAPAELAGDRTSGRAAHVFADGFAALTASAAALDLAAKGEKRVVKHVAETGGAN